MLIYVNVDFIINLNNNSKISNKTLLLLSIQVAFVICPNNFAYRGVKWDPRYL